ncbi:hypothetical protein [Enterobacter roggenkampii]|uniref:Uncharacterized protein n=1 Tax=Enterobacter roggenkampii TaxID=1812935 RepID=A0ABD7KD89_9ENTR|nr:hypothetical protein [Enterobacter roggenkampii]MEB5889761.1 hypothetical protein [Enterobacter roggenkampii]SAB12955.1 Uncharacterised protein [Enterobacter roggenkampii]SAB55801.1 Uncharacterised protein [Enterobacter roggenkampii]
MAAESWVTIGGFFATTASAIAAFFAVKQTMLQRTISTKPQIIINNQEVKAIHSLDSTFALKIEENDFYFDIPIIIKNVGLGTALNIKYSWSFDYQKHIKKCGFKEISEDPVFSPIKIRLDEWDKHYYFSNDESSSYESYKFIKNKKLNHYGIKKEHRELEYIMPVTQESSPSKIEFPTLIMLLLTEYLYSSRELDGTIFDELDAGQLHIRYEDISGNRKEILFNCTIQLMSYQSKSENGPRSTFRIEFSRIHSGSRLGLQRIRKSYVDFINEHDYNKNK